MTLRLLAFGWFAFFGLGVACGYIADNETSTRTARITLYVAMVLFALASAVCGTVITRSVTP